MKSGYKKPRVTIEAVAASRALPGSPHTRASPCRKMYSNAYFGTTAFNRKWAAALTGKVIEKKYSEGGSKYRITGIKKAGPAGPGQQHLLLRSYP